jgi:hypothetical protein
MISGVTFIRVILCDLWGEAVQAGVAYIPDKVTSEIVVLH